MVRSYELVVLLNPSLTSDLQKKQQDDIAALITSKKGVIQKADVWGRKALAYPIGKATDAIYIVYQFQSDSELMPEFTHQLQLNESIIRHLLVLTHEQP